MQPKITIGILSSKKIDFVLNGDYRCNNNLYAAAQSVELQSGKIAFKGQLYHELLFSASEEVSFDLLDVVIGIGFHWERKENQRFEGDLKFIVEDDKITAINVLPLENYLLSVISSEMSATSSLELLKAHAVISRSWLLAQLEAKNKCSTLQMTSVSFPVQEKNIEPEFIKWYDKDDHANFDVCADDHCQRYQGISKASTSFVRDAIAATKGEVLVYEGEICDARFSKCCGGVAELFENCWEPEHHAYLLGVEDQANAGLATAAMNEAQATNFIHEPDTAHFCNTTEAKVLTQVLNDYDQETPDFYRWKVSYTQTELAELIARKSDIDFGGIVDLIPIERGVSGRLIKLKIVGTKHTLTIGKELEIRKCLSESHLYSAAFTVEKVGEENGLPQEFILYGAGWGHGVGLCQIGAAVMAEKGYYAKEILLHYFRNASIERIY